MTKVKLTTGQVVAAVIAGVIGNLLFSAGFTALGFTLFAGLFAGLFGAALGGILGQSTESVNDFLTAAGGVAIGVGIGLAIGALVVMALGVFASWVILKVGRVRRPAAVTWTAVLIAGVLNLPLLIAYFAVSNNGDTVPYLLVALLGTVVVGVLVWLWMTWGHRGHETAAEAPVAVAVEPPAPPSALPAGGVAGEVEGEKK